MIAAVEELREKLIDLLRTGASRPMDVREIQRRLGLGANRRRELVAFLTSLCAAGELVCTRGKLYGLPAEMNLAHGRMQAHADGFGFVITEAPGGGRGPDVFVKARDMGGAMHGDRVLVRLDRVVPGRAAEGSVVRVLGRARTRVTGRLERSGRHGYLTPADPRLSQDLFIPEGGLADAASGQMVVAEITAWPAARRPAEGKIVEVLGAAGDPGVAEEVIIRQFDLPHRFPRKVLQDAETVPLAVSAADLKGRADLRGLLTVTIDGETARDFDDAISIALSPKSTFHLWVHIADVSHYVPAGGLLDQEAFARGTSVYFPGRVLPMLPERLSNGICSLNPGEDRLAFTVFMEFSRQGKLLAREFLEAAIHSDARLTYTQVARALEANDPAPLPPVDGLFAMLGLARDLAQRIREQRERRGSIDFDLPEEQILLDLRGNIREIVRAERNVAHRIIEELMIAANEAVAGHFARLELPSLYRVHEPPDPDKLASFAEFSASFGHHLKLPREPSAKLLADFVAGMRGRPEERVLNEVLLRSMKQAVYAMENIGHFGLASETYTHFTSPIRRYPDLVVHRLLRELLRRGRFSPARVEELSAQLPETASHASARERVAMEAEREVVSLKKTEYMADKVGDVLPGFITGVTNFGLFVELAEYPVEGLVHISTLGDDYYKHREDLRALVGANTGTTFRLGEAVTVKVAGADAARKHVDFTLVRAPGSAADAPERARGRSGKRPAAPAAGRAGKPAGPSRGGKRPGGRPGKGRRR
jgi:ribonuclease R